MNSTNNQINQQLMYKFFYTLLFATVVFAQSAFANTNGRNVNVVEFGNLGSGDKLGTFRQVGKKRWVEQNASGQRTFSFKEQQRDAWSVYLYDASRQVSLQLDLHRKIVGYKDSSLSKTRDQYSIVRSSSKLSGWLVRKVKFDGGSFVKKKGKKWVEKGADKQTRFRFVEEARDDWSVYLKDASRGVGIQLDLHTRKIMYNENGGPRRPLYNITKAK